jgi:hypothetical protein
VLEITARDHGTPQLHTPVMVNIDISDANDNPPLFSQANYSAIVQVKISNRINKKCNLKEVVMLQYSHRRISHPDLSF